jgi:hypothetical protein
MPMPRDRSADAGPDKAAADDADVIAWGEDVPPRRRRTFPLLDRLRADSRAAPLAVAVLGLAALYGSLVADWATIRIRETGSSDFSPDSFRVTPSNIGVDSGYLVGILAILAMTAVAVFGTPPLRHTARVAGMAVAAGVLVLLAAATSSLDTTLNRIFPFGPEVEVDTRYESGITLAFAATTALALALYLAGRLKASPAPTPDGAAAEPNDAGEHRPARRGEAESEEPVREVTVLPAPPFTGPDWRQQYPR